VNVYERNARLRPDNFGLTVPVWNVLVGDTRGDVEHDDTALAVDVVTITETTKLFLSSGVPDVELNLTEVLSECQ